MAVGLDAGDGALPPVAVADHPPPHLDAADSRSDDLDLSPDDADPDPDGEQPRKKRRVVKNGDKKFMCPHPDCGKSYSRAEHLYRHQLNHAPKEIYRCDFAGCDRTFVRSDLCTRHKERHTAKGSHLQRKDAFLSSQRPTDLVDGGHANGDAGMAGHHAAGASHGFQYTPVSDGYISPGHRPVHSFAAGPDHLPPLPIAMSQAHHQPNSEAQIAYEPQRTSFGSYSPAMSDAPYSPIIGGTHPSVVAQVAPATLRSINSYDGMGLAQPTPPTSHYAPPSASANTLTTPSMASTTPGGTLYSSQQYPSPVASHMYRSAPSYSAMGPSHSFTYQSDYVAPPMSAQHGTGRMGGIMSPAILPSTDHAPVSASRANSITDFAAFEHFGSGFAMPVFGSETPFLRSPSAAVDENLLNYLLNSAGADNDHASPQELPEPTHILPAQPAPPLKAETDSVTEEQLAPAPMDALDIDLPECNISEKKQARMFTVVSNFEDAPTRAGRWSRADIMAGDKHDSEHVMSLRMLKTYLASFWMHIHQQMPLLHRPTFNPETCPELLLLAMMCLGGTCLERTHSPKLARVSAEWSFFVAHHIRWEVFKDGDFQPCAKLWTFQTMLLLELFEKMYSTRPLHERAHIHHATTVTVMRRGSSLVGRSADDALGREDPTRTPPGPDGSVNTSGQNTPDAYWNRWITAEATRRTAFAAFVIDSTHATLFGHSAVMSPHDLRLPLPCDEALWAAASGTEVQRVEASLAANGFKPTTFIEGLRRTLNGTKVRTNTFGRVVLMAGLLNVSWHMNQRDLQVSSLGATNTLGSSIKWRGPLMRAFDYWRRDFDDSLGRNDQWLAPADRSSIERRDNIFESRTCLHSLAHMSMHVDIIDCQVFAGADLALGRVVLDADRAAIQRRMREQWAPSARARDSVWYALHFLRKVLLEEEQVEAPAPGAKPAKPTAGGGKNPLPESAYFKYSARDDYLLNRPWVLYFAALIVWAYGYALDGPLTVCAPAAATTTKVPNTTSTEDGGGSDDGLLPTHESRVRDMHAFLARVGGVVTPEDLGQIRERNACLGLLLLLRDRFMLPRWELLHEAAESLTYCIRALLPGAAGESLTRPTRPQER